MAEGSENTVEFLLKTRAELSGAQQLAASLEQQIGKAKALGKDYSDLQKQLDQVNASIKASTAANADLAAAEKESADAAEFMHHNHRALHMLFHEMGSETVPALGHAMTGMMMGPLGPALALMAIASSLKSAFDGWQESMDKAAEDNAEANFAGGIEAMNKALEQGKEDIATYEEHMQRISQHEVTIAQALASQLQSMRALATERAKERADAEAAAKAETSRKEKAGEITPEQAEIKNTSEAIAAAKAEFEARKREQEDEINKQQDAITQAVFKQDQLTKDYETKRANLAAVEGHRSSLEKSFGGTDDDWNKKIKPLKDARDEAEARLNEAQETADAYRKLPHSVATAGQQVNYDQAVERAKEELKEANAQVSINERGRNQYIRATSPAADEKLRQERSDSDEAKRKADANSAFVDDQSRKLDQQRKDAAAIQPIQEKELSDKIATILSQAVEKLYSFPHGAEVQQGVKFSDDIEKALRAAALGNQYQRTQNISEDDARFLMKFVNEHGGNAQTVQQSSQFAVDKWGNLNAHDTTDITEQNKSQFNQAEIFLVQLANDLGAHVKNVKDAADFVSKLKDNTSGFFDAVLQMANNGFTAQQKQLDSLFIRVQQIQETANNH